ncbi:MAG: GDP-mannose 4,6-dehydratase [Planctomycetota bacterium]|jgi:GDP-4-dehydro-6-deoxy-D-mannose reductase
MKCLVTGAPGFAGSHELLVSEGFDVVGVALPGEDLSRLGEVKGKIDLRSVDICDAAGLSEAVSGERFDYVFHLAALASVPASFEDPPAAVRVNTLGTANLLDALRSKTPEKFIHISSADVYGTVRPEDTPLREGRPQRPSNPYAASKAAAEIICLQYWRTFALPVVILRPFNHTGPGQGPGFAPSDFARAIARIEKGADEPRLAVGNLDSERDYSDVRDIVKAYVAAARAGEAGEVYNVSSGRAVRISEVLEALLSGGTAEIEVVQDPAKMRPSDTPLVVGDSSKFRRRTVWSNTIDLKKTLADLLDWWRGVV